MSLTQTRLRSVASRFSIRYGLIAIAVILALGTLGFHLIEGWPWMESLYTATQTVTTVGYGDLAPQTYAGRLFAIVFMIAGVGTVLYALTSIVQTVVQSELIAAFGQRRRSREIRRVQKHFIICGAGRVGSRIIRELQRARCPFVVIEREQQKVADLLAQGEHVIVGDSTLEEILKEAGVVPPEVELMQRIEALRQSLESAPDDATARAGRQKLSDMRQQLALRLEKLRSTGSL
jgi:voltage-gated potassium channel